MPRLNFVFLIALALAATTFAEDLLVYSAHRGIDSRIYVRREDGSQKFFHYPNHRFYDMTVVDNEVYVAEALGPVLFRVDLKTGDLTQVVNDLSLIYFYGLAFDGNHFYVKEWNLRRYDSDGEYAGGADFDGDALGMAWDGEFLWVLDEANKIQAWDISAWPEVTAVEGKVITPPSASCRGLWFDGETFWSAESVDGSGKIFRFDHQGKVTGTFPEPIGKGWGAVVVQRAKGALE